MRITVADVRDRLSRIERLKGDGEVAHYHQDELFREVLTAIASGDVSLRGCRSVAAEALKVDDIPFERWMA